MDDGGCCAGYLDIRWFMPDAAWYLKPAFIFFLEPDTIILEIYAAFLKHLKTFPLFLPFHNATSQIVKPQFSLH